MKNEETLLQKYIFIQHQRWSHCTVRFVLFFFGCYCFGSGLRSDVHTHTALSCNVNETLIYMWQNTWESRRPATSLDDQQLLAVEGSKVRRHPGLNSVRRSPKMLQMQRKHHQTASRSHQLCR